MQTLTIISTIYIYICTRWYDFMFFSDCPQSNMCLGSKAVCVECLSSNECPAEGSFCDASYTCSFRCDNDNGCMDGDICLANMCIEKVVDNYNVPPLVERWKFWVSLSLIGSGLMMLTVTSIVWMRSLGQQQE